jgi:dCMP deaminase
MNDSYRPPWDHFWFVQAMMYSTRGTCDRLRTACIIVKDKRLVGAGYNGSPKGTPHCDDDGVGHLLIDNHCERTLHGEENAILNTERGHLVGATAYIIGTPCIRCAKLLVSAGLVEVKYLGAYRNSRGKEYIKELSTQSGVTFTSYGDDPKSFLAEAS